MGDSAVVQTMIAEGNRRVLDRPITGVIHKDRIWEQWYDADIFEKEFPKMSQKDYLFLNNPDEDRVLLDYRGKRKISVGEFKKIVLEYERAFAATDYHVGDIVCTIALSTPELYAIKYAATSLGLITCNLNPLDVDITDGNKCRLLNQIENVNPRFLFVADILEEKVYKIVNTISFEKMLKVIMPIDYSLAAGDFEKFLLTVKSAKLHIKGEKIKGSISLSAFLQMGEKIEDSAVKEVYEEGMPCNISFTSGTTGVNKAVLLSHDANNALAFQQVIGKMGMKRGDRQLALVPPFLAFWDADVVHAVLAQGGTNIIELALTFDKIPEYFSKHDNINVGIWSQYLWSSIINLPKDLRDKIRSSMRFAIVGGERCDINEAKRFYEETGILQNAGFGTSEVNTTFSYTHENCYKLGTAGIPLPFNNVKIVDDNFKDVTYNVPGRLLITGPCLMEGYYNRPDLTARAIMEDENGLRWYNTGDYAFMDEDGCLTVLDRYNSLDDIITSEGIEKVNLVDVAEKILPCECIKHCKLMSVEGLMVLHVSFKANDEDEKTSSQYKLAEYIINRLPQKYWPDYVAVYDELPRTSVGKVDYKKLKGLSKDVYKSFACNEKLTFCRL